MTMNLGLLLDFIYEDLSELTRVVLLPILEEVRQRYPERSRLYIRSSTHVHLSEKSLQLVNAKLYLVQHLASLCIPRL